MPTIICHPDNFEALKRKVDKGEFTRPGFTFADFRVATSSAMERDKPSGRYKLPGGRIAEKADIIVEDRFVTYGPEDLEWLLYAGIMSEERELVFMLVDDIIFGPRQGYGPVITDRRILFNPSYS